MTSEASICMKTNKHMTICPQEKMTFLHNCMLLVWHFIQKQAYFAGTVGSFITIRALANEPLASKCRNSRAASDSSALQGRRFLFAPVLRVAALIAKTPHPLRTSAPSPLGEGWKSNRPLPRGEGGGHAPPGEGSLLQLCRSAPAREIDSCQRNTSIRRLSFRACLKKNRGPQERGPRQPAYEAGHDC